jgi:hypothetical protein
MTSTAASGLVKKAYLYGFPSILDQTYEFPAVTRT